MWVEGEGSPIRIETGQYEQPEEAKRYCFYCTYSRIKCTLFLFMNLITEFKMGRCGEV